MAVVQNKPTDAKAAQQQTVILKPSTFLERQAYLMFCTVFFSSRDIIVVCKQFGQPEHVSGTEDHIKLRAVQLRSSLRHLRRLGETRLLQQKLTWRDGKTCQCSSFQQAVKRPVQYFLSHVSRSTVGQ